MTTGWVGGTGSSTQPAEYDLVFLESEEHSVTYVGRIQQIEDHRAADAAGTAPLDVTRGYSCA